MRKCRHCKAELPPVKLSDKIAAKGFCSFDCAAKYGLQKARQQKQKAEQKEKKQARAEKKSYYAKDYSYQFRLTRQAAQRLGNLLDAMNGFGCISCGTTNPVQYCGGHYKTAGGHPEIALDIRNISRQCNHYCNKHLSGNIHGNKNSAGYKAGLIGRYGQKYVDYLEGYHQPKNYTCDDLIAMRAEFASEIRRLLSGEKPLKDWRAIK